MLQQIRIQVVRIIARASGQLPSTLRGFFLLRRSADEVFGLGMSDTAILGMTPALNALVADYGQRVTREEVLDPDNVKTVSDVWDLVESKVESGLDEVREQVVKILAEAALSDAVGAEAVTETTLLIAPPLNLTPTTLESVRLRIVREVPHWRPGITLTPEEMAQVSNVQQLTDLVIAEITHPISS